MGGARKGAGRKAGSKDSKPRVTAARKLAAAATAEGISPAEMMLRTAQHLWGKATDEAGTVIDLDMATKACAIAEKAAPYFNPKLATIAHTGEGGGAIQADLTVRFVASGASKPA
jgi:hypothetical protein